MHHASLIRTLSSHTGWGLLGQWHPKWLPCSPTLAGQGSRGCATCCYFSIVSLGMIPGGGSWDCGFDELSHCTQEGHTSPASARNRGIGALQGPARCRSALGQLLPGPGRPRASSREGAGPAGAGALLGRGPPSIPSARQLKGKCSMAPAAMPAQSPLSPGPRLVRVQGRSQGPYPGAEDKPVERWERNKWVMFPKKPPGKSSSAGHDQGLGLAQGPQGLARARLQGPSCPGSGWP